MAPRIPSPVDWLVAGVVGLFAVAEEIGERTAAPDRQEAAWWIAAGVAAAVLVLFRRRAPFGVLSAYTIANVAGFLLVADVAAAWQYYTQLLLLFTLLSEVRPRDRRAVTGLAMTGVFVAAMLAASSNAPGWGDVAVAVVMTTVAAGAGIAVRRYRALAVRAAERGELLAREAVSAERARIARELHDIVVHSVSVMTMRTGGVRLMLGQERAPEREILATVEATGREAVEELRLMLNLLRGPESDGTVPIAGLDRLDELVDQVRAAGLTVKTEIHGEPVPLPPALDLSAYRILQEALTNTLKHAGPADVTVTVGYRPRELTLEVVDRGPSGPPPRPGESGYGLVGMRERVAMFGGTLAAGPVPEGGFRVRAVLPV
ncbi:sensor histidine kinase [Nonomuraea sp. C10]|jgi:signal transduction histidine kinase|uniref:sensor histidine kinase n=1 Tax=Nonomuraea sp. C10 TaxID=2600577 RepID=UPI0011CE8CC0|nr:sensor histidine kinase [Nonomuraea sp. C10]TXK39409.1 sensor histidine kinase [Nonomuraea sp. C10]